MKIEMYSRDSSRKVLEWKGEVINHDSYATILLSFGELIGKKHTISIQVTEGKNIGKSNETTPYQQAVRDLQGRALRQKRKGYKMLIDLPSSHNVKTELDLKWFLDENLPINNTDIDGFAKPMKAQPYYKDDGSIRIKFPCIAQPKINGFRCICYLEKSITNDLLEEEKLEVKFKSKNGLVYNLPLIAETMREYFTNEVIKERLLAMYDINLEDVIFDGEMYIPDTLLEDISSAVRKPNANTSLLQYYIFDLAIPEYKQSDRLSALKTIFTTGTIPTLNVKRVPNKKVNDDAEAQVITDNYIADGHEGAIFRAYNAEYLFGKRPMTMVKLKRRESAEFLIVDVVDSDKAPGVAIFLCKNDVNSEYFKVNPEGTIEKKKEYYSNKNECIGKMLTVEFYERTKRDIPFHAVGITIRDYE